MMKSDVLCLFILTASGLAHSVENLIAEQEVRGSIDRAGLIYSLKITEK